MFKRLALIALLALGSLSAQASYTPPNGGSGGSCDPTKNYCVGWQNVVFYGADPTGVNDSTSAIQSAVEAIGTDGGVLYFPTGTYKFSSFTISNPGTYIRGDGIQATILAPTAGSGDAIVIGGTSSTITLDMGISDLQIAPSGTRTSGYMVHLENIQGALVKNVFMYTPGHSYMYSGLGIDCYVNTAGCYTDHLENVSVAGPQQNGIDIGANSTGGPPSDVFMDNIDIGQVGATGIDIDWVSGLYADHAETGGGVYGWGFFPSTGHWISAALISNSLADSATSHGYYFSGAGFFSDIHLIGCWGSSNEVNGLYVDSSATGLTGLEIVGGEYENNNQFGLLFNAGENITLSAVHAGNNSAGASNTYDGIAFGGSATQFKVVGSTSGVVGYPWTNSTPRQRYGINVVSGTNNNYVLTNNILANNVTGGLADAGSTSKVICFNISSGVTANCGGGGGSGTVNSGTTNQLAYYASSGNVVSGTSTPTVTTLTATGSSNIALEMASGNGLYCYTGCGTNPQNLIYGSTGGTTWLGSPSGSGGGNIVAQNTIEPSAANSLNLGATGDQWQNIYSEFATIGTSATINSNPVLNGSSIVNGDCAQYSGTTGTTVSVTCGTISAVNAGSNLTGGGSSGSVTLAVSATPSFTDVNTNTYNNSSGTQIVGYISGSNTTFVGTGGAVGLEGNTVPNGDNAYSFGNSSFRWVALWAVNGTIQTSDGRKKNILGDETLGRDFINCLRPVPYRWKTDSDKVEASHGFVAQDVQACLGDTEFAGLVKPDPNDQNSSWALRYTDLLAPLVKAYQQLDQIVEVHSYLILILFGWNGVLTILFIKRRAR